MLLSRNVFSALSQSLISIGVPGLRLTVVQGRPAYLHLHMLMALQMFRITAHVIDHIVD